MIFEAGFQKTTQACSVAAKRFEGESALANQGGQISKREFRGDDINVPPIQAIKCAITNAHS